MREDQRVVTERLLAKAFGDDVRIAGAADLGGRWAPVQRLILDNGSTVVVKTRGEDARPWGAEPAVLDNERRGLELVNALGVDVAPRLLAADGEHGILVMTDVGTGPCVRDLLFGESASEATAGLVALAHATGALHAASAGVECRWDARATFLDRTFEFWPELRAAAADLDFPAPVGVSADLEGLETALADPRFRVFVHGDLWPNNAVLASDRARLVDFEGSGFRHVALDLAFLRLPFPVHGYGGAALPAEAIDAVDEAYRAELAGGCAAARDAEAYAGAIAAGCAAWAIIRAHRLRLIASPGQDPADVVCRREQVVRTLTSTARIALQVRRFEALARWFLALAEAMRERWTEASRPPREFRAYSAPARPAPES